MAAYRKFAVTFKTLRVIKLSIDPFERTQIFLPPTRDQIYSFPRSSEISGCAMTGLFPLLKKWQHWSCTGLKSQHIGRSGVYTKGKKVTALN